MSFDSASRGHWVDLAHLTDERERAELLAEEKFKEIQQVHSQQDLIAGRGASPPSPPPSDEASPWGGFRATGAMFAATPPGLHEVRLWHKALSAIRQLRDAIPDNHKHSGRKMYTAGLVRALASAAPPGVCVGGPRFREAGRLAHTQQQQPSSPPVGVFVDEPACIVPVATTVPVATLAHELRSPASLGGTPPYHGWGQPTEHNRDSRLWPHMAPTPHRRHFQGGV